jgi:hypothetical protein
MHTLTYIHARACMHTRTYMRARPRAHVRQQVCRAGGIAEDFVRIGDAGRSQAEEQEGQ